MKVAVISDLHLGAGDGADWFGHRDEEFIPFLRFLEDNFEKVVLLGDIYETLRMPTPAASRVKLRACREAHIGISERFESDQYLYVHGNHDLVALYTESTPTSLSLNLDGTRLLLTHGHQNDFIIRHLRWFSEFGAWAAGWVSRMGLLPFIRKIEGLEDRLRGNCEDPATCKFQRWARSVATSHHYDVIVTGHTHDAMSTEYKNVQYLNSGACCHGEFNWVSLDTRTHDFAVHQSW